MHVSIVPLFWKYDIQLFPTVGRLQNSSTEISWTIYDTVLLLFFLH